jgi:hypothetical protein
MTMPALFILAGILAVAGLRQLPMVGAQGSIPLVNADFEGGFSVRESQEVEVANGWDYSYMSGDDRWCRAPCYRPEFKPETVIAVEGTSQRWFATFARQFGTIHQLVEVDSDQWYTFECQVYAISEPDGQQAVFVGIQPWGTGVFDRTMVWGEQQPWGSYREWHTLSVTARAYGGRIRVAVGSNNNYPTKNNAAYVDQCVLRRADGPAQPTPAPTYTPYPTLTPWPTPEPCPTSPPGVGCDYDTIRQVVREELDKTILTGTR